MSEAQLERIVQFMDAELGVDGFPDYPTALNGLQVAGPERVHRIASAVDCSEQTIERAVEAEIDLLIVHHGLFWAGLEPIVGRHHRKLRRLLTSDLALYSAHLPLDAHGDLGNAAILAERLDVAISAPFGAYRDRHVGWRGELRVDRDELTGRTASVLGGSVHLVPGGPETISSVGVVTGGGASFISEAAALGLDALVTGEGSHHHHHDAMELGINLYLGGHYATETFGVCALGQRVAERFGLEWQFFDLPTGL